MLVRNSLILIFVFLFTQLSYAQEKKSIAVLELEPGGISPYEAQVLTNRLRTELFQTDKFTVLERDKMDEILIEQGFQLSGCTTNECVIEVGQFSERINTFLLTTPIFMTIANIIGIFGS